MRDATLTAEELGRLDALAGDAVRILLTENLHRVDFHDTPILLVGATYAGTSTQAAISR